MIFTEYLERKRKKERGERKRGDNFVNLLSSCSSIVFAFVKNDVTPVDIGSDQEPLLSSLVRHVYYIIVSVHLVCYTRIVLMLVIPTGT